MTRKIKWIFLVVTALLFSLQACTPKIEATPTESPAITATSPIVATDPHADKTATTQVTETPTETPQHSVVLISWDGSRSDFIFDLMDGGYLPTFAGFLDKGIQAEFAQTIDPSLTAAAHNSMSSGSLPTHTGITSNNFHVAGDDFNWYRVGFDETMDEAEPIWVTASKNGLTTASVFFVGGSPSHNGQLADYTVGFGIQDAYSNQRSVELSSGDNWIDLPTSYNAPLEGQFTIQNVGTVYLCALDMSDDGNINYDTVILNTEPSGSIPAQTLQINQWGSLVLLPRSYAGAHFLIKEISNEKVVVFHTGVNHNNAAPNDMEDAINNGFGFFPAGPDYYALEHGWITENDYVTMIERQANYLADVAVWVY